MTVKNLKTLHMTRPLGIDVNPYFSWMLESAEPNTCQKSYHLTVTDESGSLCMDTGIQEDDKSTYHPYQGAPLKSRTRYSLNVTVTDNHGGQASASSWFETALLSEEDWSADWAKSPLKTKKRKPGFGKQSPATMFRQNFGLREKPIKARLYVTCHGTYQLYVNGTRPDERYFAPEHTVYEKYLCYQTYDVTALCQEEENTLSMYVGDGWYMCPQTLPNMKKNDQTHAVLFQLEAIYSDGSQDTICSGTNTKASYGPVLSSDLFAGEQYDATKELDGWTKNTFDDSAWTPCKIGNYGFQNLKAQLGEPVIAAKELPVVNVLHSPKGETILDFGQNMAGHVRMNVSAPRGTVITLEHCEVLDKEGNYFNNIMAAGGVGKGCDQKDEYTSNGTPSVYEPHFTYHGFRYVRVMGVDVRPEDFTAIVLTSQKEDLGTFVTSDPRLNRLYENIRWSQTSNTLSIPTDCPQREKAGWTGDMLVYAKTAMLNEDCTAFFSRWLYNVSADQDSYGIIPMVVPQVGNYPATGKLMQMMYGAKGSGTSSGWGDAAVVVPYSMYQVTGNTDVLRQQYYCMRRWVDYIIAEAASKKPKGSKLPDEIENYLWDTGYHYGEWLIPSQNKDGLDMKNLKQIMGMSSCYTAPIFGWNSVQTFADIAGILAKDSLENALYETDQKQYQEIADKMKTAIQKGVIRPDGSMPSELMGAYVLPIYFDLVPKEHKESFANRLIHCLEQNDMRMDTGFLASPYLLDALCKIGREDLASTLLWQDKTPSWLSEVDAGGTTIWENTFGYDKDGNPGHLSFNHYAFGCVADWMYRKLSGIDTKTAGFKELVIAPRPLGGLTSCSRSYQTEYGTVTSNWKLTKTNGNTRFQLHVAIPCNTTATVILPNGQTESVGSGEYDYEINLSI